MEFSLCCASFPPRASLSIVANMSLALQVDRIWQQCPQQVFIQAIGMKIMIWKTIPSKFIPYFQSQYEYITITSCFHPPCRWHLYFKTSKERQMMYLNHNDMNGRRTMWWIIIFWVDVAKPQACYFQCSRRHEHCGFLLWILQLS